MRYKRPVVAVQELGTDTPRIRPSLDEPPCPPTGFGGNGDSGPPSVRSPPAPTVGLITELTSNFRTRRTTSRNSTGFREPRLFSGARTWRPPRSRGLNRRIREMLRRHRHVRASSEIILTFSFGKGRRRHCNSRIEYRARDLNLIDLDRCDAEIRRTASTTRCFYLVRLPSDPSRRFSHSATVQAKTLARWEHGPPVDRSLGPYASGDALTERISWTRTEITHKLSGLSKSQSGSRHQAPWRMSPRRSDRCLATSYSAPCPSMELIATFRVPADQSASNRKRTCPPSLTTHPAVGEGKWAVINRVGVSMQRAIRSRITWMAAALS